MKLKLVVAIAVALETAVALAQNVANSMQMLPSYVNRRGVELTDAQYIDVCCHSFRVSCDMEFTWEAIAGSGGHPPPTSGAETIMTLLPPDVALVAAWKTTFAHELSVTSSKEEHDVFLCGDDTSAKRTVGGLVRCTGFRPLDCGGLEQARTLEGMTRLMGPIARNLGLQSDTVPAFRFAAHRLASS